jgi:hypothetical protein
LFHARLVVRVSIIGNIFAYCGRPLLVFKNMLAVLSELFVLLSAFSALWITLLHSHTTVAILLVVRRNMARIWRRWGWEAAEELLCFLKCMLKMGREAHRKNKKMGA